MQKAIQLNEGRIAIVNYYTKYVDSRTPPNEEGKKEYTYKVGRIFILANPEYDNVSTNILDWMDFVAINEAIQEIKDRPNFWDFPDD